MDEDKKLLSIISEAILDKKGEELIQIDLTDLNCSFADIFLICHGNSIKQVEAIADFVERRVKEVTGQRPGHIEGKNNSNWILIDYHSIIVHVFDKEHRDYYKLEELWADAHIKLIKD